MQCSSEPLQQRLYHVADVVSAEATTLLEGLKLAQSIGWNILFVEMDNITFVGALNLNVGHSMIAAHILVECRKSVKDFGQGAVL